MSDRASPSSVVVYVVFLSAGVWQARVPRSPSSNVARPGVARAGRRPGCLLPASSASRERSGCSSSIWRAKPCGRRLPASWRRRRVMTSATGTKVRLVAALNRDDVEQLRFSYEFQAALGVELRVVVGRGGTPRLEPHLPAGVPAAVYSPNDHQVDNRRLVEALAVAFARKRVASCASTRSVTRGGDAGGMRGGCGVRGRSASTPRSWFSLPAPGRGTSRVCPRPYSRP